jgi:hypothetical protein
MNPQTLIPQSNSDDTKTIPPHNPENLSSVGQPNANQNTAPAPSTSNYPAASYQSSAEQPTAFSAYEQQQPRKRKGLSTSDFILVLIVVLTGIGPGLIIVGTYLSIKALINKNAKKILKGVLLVVLGIVITLAVFIFLQKSSSEVKSLVVGNDTVEIKIPSGFKEIQKETDYIAYGIPASGSTDRYVGQISAQAYQKAGNFSASDSESLGSFANSQQFKNNIQQNLTAYCPNAKIDNAEKINIPGAILAFSTTFTCPLQSDNSEYGGSVISAFSAEDTFTITIAAEKEVWLADAKNWDNTVASIKIEAH